MRKRVTELVRAIRTEFRERPWRSSAELAMAGILLSIAGYTTALATEPKPAVSMRPLAWQAEAEPVPNTGRDKAGRTLEQHRAGLNARGQSVEDWVAAGNPAKTFVMDPLVTRSYGLGDAATYQPIPATQFEAGTDMYVLRYQCFTNKLAEPYIYRFWLGGAESPVAAVSRTVKEMPPSPAPARTDGCSIRNFATRIPRDLNPEGVEAMVWTYAPQARFLDAFPRPPASFWFAPVTVLVVSPPGQP